MVLLSSWTFPQLLHFFLGKGFQHFQQISAFGPLA
jgi:hypothetical protein